MESAKLDLRPVMAFACRTNRRRLTILAKNTGWGAATCRGQLRNVVLQQVFTAKQLAVYGRIGSGKEESLSTLDVRRARPQWIDELRRSVVWTVMPTGEKGKAVGKVEFVGHCLSGDGIRQDITATVDPYDEERTIEDSTLLVSEDGFEIGGSSVAYNTVLSFPTFVAVLDPAAVPGEKEYTLARQIAPGDAERFFITVVATRSARLRLRLKFFADESTVLTSDAIEVDLSCPTDYEPNVRDGDEIELDGDTWVVTRKGELGIPDRPLRGNTAPRSRLHSQR